MKPIERDELLIRLDERVARNLILTEKQEQHLLKLNESVSKNVLHINLNHNRLNTLENIVSNGFQLKLNRKQMATGGVGFGSIILMILVATGKLLGWW